MLPFLIILDNQTGKSRILTIFGRLGTVPSKEFEKQSHGWVVIGRTASISH